MKPKEAEKYYIKYKKLAFPLVFIGLSLLLFFLVILPEISSISSSNQDITDTSQKIQTLQSSLSTLSTQPNLDPNFDLTNRALPTAKSLSSIFNALVSASGESNTTVKSFSVRVGGIYGRSAQVDSGVSGVPFVNLTADVTGDTPADVIQFSKVIQERLPLAEVTKVDSSKNDASFEISFFYKIQDLSVLSKQDDIAPLSGAEENLIGKLKAWDK